MTLATAVVTLTDSLPASLNALELMRPLQGLALAETISCPCEMVTECQGSSSAGLPLALLWEMCPLPLQSLLPDFRFSFCCLQLVSSASECCLLNKMVTRLLRTGVLKDQELRSGAEIAEAEFSQVEGNLLCQVSRITSSGMLQNDPILFLTPPGCCRLSSCRAELSRHCHFSLPLWSLKRVVSPDTSSLK